MPRRKSSSRPRKTNTFAEVHVLLSLDIALAGKYSSELFNKRGALREIQKLRMWNLEEVLQDKYLLVPEEAKSLAS